MLLHLMAAVQIFLCSKSISSFCVLNDSWHYCFFFFSYFLFLVYKVYKSGQA